MAATWVVKGNLKGPRGDKGETGKSVRSSDIDIQSNATVPLANIKPNTNVAVGDTIFDIDGEVFTVTAVTETGATVGTALSGVSMKGPKGDKGMDGAPGKDGTGVTILGSYDSIEALKAEHATGNAGDAYLIGGHLYVWDTVGADWKDVGTIQGPKGDKGEPGINGKDGTNGTNGLGWSYGHGVPTSTGVPVGSLYLDIDTGNVYAFSA